ncbi:MAG: hypothetical protein JWM04_1499, partial [Verrucomicrobiales bacterium]|nr:hypothetical protein [Verrucomicrobiales bacterium]
MPRQFRCSVQWGYWTLVELDALRQETFDHAW